MRGARAKAGKQPGKQQGTKKRSENLKKNRKEPASGRGNVYTGFLKNGPKKRYCKVHCRDIREIFTLRSVFRLGEMYGAGYKQ